jgi:hypothetical protein
MAKTNLQKSTRQHKPKRQTCEHGYPLPTLQSLERYFAEQRSVQKLLNLYIGPNRRIVNRLKRVWEEALPCPACPVEK